ncbi:MULTISPECIES: DUF6527 family protein [unclassified Microbacterium]|uniref:DUF6527 family protein n=1 Tax=Microbacterium TaxID=33882 RepID=UPI003BA01148
MKIAPIENVAGGWTFRCPGCGTNHQITTPKWEFNGDVDRPTIGGSVLVGGTQWAADHPFHKAAHSAVPAGGATVCHSFVRDGRIEFLTDSTHALAGQTVELPHWPHA